MLLRSGPTLPSAPVIPLIVWQAPQPEARIACWPRSGSPPPVRARAAALLRCSSTFPSTIATRTAAAATSIAATAKPASRRRCGMAVPSGEKLFREQPECRGEIDDGAGHPHDEPGELLVLDPGQAADR